MKTIRPESLTEFVGQANARRILNVLITAAKQRGEPVPHVLMSGPPGLGKTTLARIIAAEIGGRLVEVIGSAIKTPMEMTQHLMGLKSHDVLFVDEIHALPRRLEELLYPAMEDQMVNVTENSFDDLMKQLSIRQSDKTTTRRQLPPFTFVGATTLLGLTSAPLRSRFRQIIELETYCDTDLATIIGKAAVKLGFTLQLDIVQEIAVRSRATARTAISNLLWYRDYVMANGGVASKEALEAAFDLKGVDRQGLTRQDREYLRHLVQADKAVSVDTIASLLNESMETILASIEPFLLRQGLITRTQRGRMATEKAKQMFEEVTL